MGWKARTQTDEQSEPYHAPPAQSWRRDKQNRSINHGNKRCAYSTRLEDITIIAIQRGGHLGNRTARHVDDSREQLARHLVHIGDHQHKSLGRRERGTEKTSNQGSVESSGGSSFRLPLNRPHCSYLHLSNSYGLSKHVLKTLVGPRVAVLRHTRRGGDGKQHGGIRHLVNGMGSSLVTVDGDTLPASEISGNNSLGDCRRIHSAVLEGWYQRTLSNRSEHRYSNLGMNRSRCKRFLGTLELFRGYSRIPC